MRDPSGVERTKGRKDLDEESERDVDPRGRGIVRVRGHGFDEIRQPAAGDEFRIDSQVAGARIALHPEDARDALVFDPPEAGHTVLQGALVGGQLGTENQPLDRRTGDAIENERTPAQAIFIAGSRERLGLTGRRC
jgi:hypothetical protein